MFISTALFILLNSKVVTILQAQRKVSAVITAPGFWIFYQKPCSTLSSCIYMFEFPPSKSEIKGGWEPSFASCFTLNFRVVIRPYWPEQVHSFIMDIELDLCYQNQNVRGRKKLKKEQSLILFTVRNISRQFYATSYIVSVCRWFDPLFQCVTTSRR